MDHHTTCVHESIHHAYAYVQDHIHAGTLLVSHPASALVVRSGYTPDTHYQQAPRSMHAYCKGVLVYLASTWSMNNVVMEPAQS